MKVLSKSRFKIGLSCPNKLYFCGNETYKNKEDDNTFLATLAEGGFQVEALSRQLYHGGHFINAPYGAYEQAFNQTLDLLKQEEVVIYEAAFLYDGLFVMTDILIKKGNLIKLIEVKAKSFDSTENNMAEKLHRTNGSPLIKQQQQQLHGTSNSLELCTTS